MALFGYSMLLKAQVIPENIDLKAGFNSLKTSLVSLTDTLVDSKESKKKKEGRALTQAEKNAFYQLDIPAIISGTSAMSKASFKNLTLGIDDELLSFSTGLRKQSEEKPAKMGMTIKAKAPDDTKPLFTGGKFSSQFSSEFRYTFGDNTYKWYLYNAKMERLTDTLSSVWNTWWNIYTNFGISNLSIILTDSTSKTVNPFNIEFLVSFNSAFHSLYINRYIHRRNILSVAAGFGRFNNYTSLEEQTLQTGKSGPSGDRFLVTETVSGRRGDYKNSWGAIIRSAVYIPLTSPFALNAVYTGINLNSFGLFGRDHVLNGVAGIYWSKRKVAESEADKTVKVLKEEFSLGLMLNMKGLDQLRSKSFFSEIAEVGISAKIPLKF